MASVYQFVNYRSMNNYSAVFMDEIKLFTSMINLGSHEIALIV